MKTLPGRAACMHTISQGRLKLPSPPRPFQRPSDSRLLVDRVQHRAHRRRSCGAHVRRASRGDRRRLDALAQELGRPEYSGSAEDNVWLHKRTMRELSANGGKVPAEFLD